MKVAQLETNNLSVRLIEPDVDRDAQLGVEWLNGELGRSTMLLMGNSEETLNEILPTTLDQEKRRVRDFIERTDQLNWMIECEGRVVGTVWVDLEDSGDLLGPAVHIMIGDAGMRGKGVGIATIAAVLDYLDEQGNNTVYSRHMTSNEQADRLLKSLGFENLGVAYVSSGVTYQNLVRHTEEK